MTGVTPTAGGPPIPTLLKKEGSLESTRPSRGVIRPVPPKWWHLWAIALPLMPVSLLGSCRTAKRGRVDFWPNLPSRLSGFAYSPVALP